MVDPKLVKVGHIMLFTYWGQVTDVEPERLRVRNIDTGTPFSVLGNELTASAFSADTVSSSRPCTMTHAAELLSTAYNRPFTVCFSKKDSTERTLRGRLLKPEPLLGRSTVMDLDEVPSNGIRLVDHRTIKWLILDGVKWEVK